MDVKSSLFVDLLHLENFWLKVPIFYNVAYFMAIRRPFWKRIPNLGETRSFVLHVRTSFTGYDVSCNYSLHLQVFLCFIRMHGYRAVNTSCWKSLSRQMHVKLIRKVLTSDYLRLLRWLFTNCLNSCIRNTIDSDRG